MQERHQHPPGLKEQPQVWDFQDLRLERAISHNKPDPEDDSITVKGLAEGDEEDAGTETAAAADTPLDSDGGVALSDGGVTLQESNVGGNIEEKDEEGVEAVVADAENDGGQDHEEEDDKSKTRDNA